MDNRRLIRGGLLRFEVDLDLVVDLLLPVALAGPSAEFQFLLLCLLLHAYSRYGRRGGKLLVCQLVILIVRSCLIVGHAHHQGHLLLLGMVLRSAAHGV